MNKKISRCKQCSQAIKYGNKFCSNVCRLRMAERALDNIKEALDFHE